MAVENAGYQDYQQYTQTHDYVTVGGIVQLPVAGLDSQTRLIRLHGGYGKRIVRFTANRYGRPPVIPLPETESGDVLLNNKISPCLPRPNVTAGGYDWSVSGEYEFAQSALRVPGESNYPTSDFPFALPLQTALATTLGGQRYNPIKAADTLVAFDTGGWVWPFTDYPTPTFAQELIQ